MAAPERQRLAARGVFARSPGIVVAVVFFPLVGPFEEGFVFAVLSLLFLAGELLVLGEVLLVGGVDRLSFRLELLHFGELGLHGFALQIRLVLGPGRVRG